MNGYVDWRMWISMQIRCVLKVAVMVCVLCCLGCQKTPTTKGQAVELMRNYGQHHRVDDAIRIGSNWSAAHPDDAEMRVLVGLMYLEKARSSTKDRESLVVEATHWVDQGLQLGQDVATLTEAASAFQIAGDLSENTRCDQYQKAANVLARVVELDNTYLGTKHDDDAEKWRQIVSMDQSKAETIKKKIANSRCH